MSALSAAAQAGDRQAGVREDAAKGQPVMKGAAALVSADGRFDMRKITAYVDPASGLRHPGILQDTEMLEALARSLVRGDPGRIKLWDMMISSSRGRIDKRNWVPSDGALDRIHMPMKMAGAGATRYALEWIMTGRREAAEAAVEILNAWAGLEKITGKPEDKHRHRRLIVGINGGYLPHAAELLRCSGAPWKRDDQERFKQMLRRAILPALEPRPGNFNGNWDLGCTWTSLACSVFMDDRALFDANIDRLKRGRTNGSIPNYLLPSGQCQESGRDQTHPQMGLYFLSLGCQVAWHQGVDLFEFEGRSLGRCYEYLAAYNTGVDDLPFEVYPSPVGRSGHDKATTISANGRGELQHIFEPVYHHYHDRRGIDMPHVRRALGKTRPEQPSANNNFWNTLCYSDLELKRVRPSDGANAVDVGFRRVGNGRPRDGAVNPRTQFHIGN